MRNHKRPIVTYTEVLNSISEEEWDRLKLPLVATVRHVPNVQLADLVCPSFLPATSFPCSHGETVVFPAGCPTHVEEEGVMASEVNVDATLCVGDAVDLGCGRDAVEAIWTSYDVPNVSASVSASVSAAQLGEVSSQCHPQCYAGLGGEVLCLYDIERQHDLPNVSSPTGDLGHFSQ